jgi:signal transduction histidine kinase/putative methionine-R-sulfoxide reductase with GAF domain
MAWQYTPYIIPLILTTGLAIGVAVAAWQRRGAEQGAVPLVILMVGVAVWCLAYAMRLGATTRPLKIFWARVRYLGIVMTPGAMFAFALQYTNRARWLQGKRMAWLALEPTVMALLVWTNGSLHRLVWQHIHLTQYETFVGWRADHGLAFWLHTAYSYALFSFVLLWLIQTWFRSSRFYRPQVGVFLVGAITTLLGSVVSVFDLHPFNHLDLTPFSFALAGSLIAFGLFHYRLLGIVPVAHDAVIAGIREGVLIIDAYQRVVDVNPAACRDVLDCIPKQVIGKSVQEVLSRWPDFFDAKGDLRAEGSEIAIRREGETHYYDVQVSVLGKQGDKCLGWCIVFHDITLRKQAEAALQSREQLYKNLVSVAKVTAEQLDLDATLQNTLDIAAKISAAEGGALLLVDEMLHVTHRIVVSKEGKIKRTRQTLQQVMDQGLAGWVAQHREAVVLEDAIEDYRWLPLERPDFVTRSVLAMPLINQGVLLGVLTLQHSQPGRFDADDLLVMQAAAHQMATAVHNAQIYEAQRNLAQRVSTLYDVMEKLGGHLNPKTVPQVAVDAIARLTGWPSVAILAPDPVEKTLRVEAASSLDAIADGWRVPWDEGVRGEAFQGQEARYVSDLCELVEPSGRAVSACSRMVIPLCRGERVLGLLDVSSSRSYAFDTDDRQQAELLAESVALSLDVARSHAEIGGYVADLSALYEVSRAVGQTLVLESLLAETLEVTLNSLGFESGLILLRQPEAGTLSVAVKRNLPKDIDTFIEGKLSALWTHVYEGKTPLMVGDVASGSHALGRALEVAPSGVEVLRAARIRTCAISPLLHQETSIGVLCLFAQTPREYSAHDIALQMAIGRQIATAVVNARLFQAVADERSRLHAIIETSRDGILLLGVDFNIQVINQRAVDLLSLPDDAETWMQRNAMALFPALRKAAPDVAQVLMRELRHAQRNDEMYDEGEFEFDSRAIQWFYMPVRTEMTLLGWLIILRDITEERLLDKMRNDLTHTMVHDLRNPLTGISGAVKLLNRSLSKKMLTSNEIHMIGVLDRSTQRMLDLVNAILDIGKLESGRMPLQRDELALNGLIKKVLDAQSPLAEAEGVALSKDLPTPSPVVYVDADLLERVVQNLVDNAIKFTPEAGRVNVRVARNGSGNFKVSVQDTGRGVPSEVQGRLFEKFVTGNQYGRGSGLGLAFCRMVIELHGERIWMEETSAAGTTFSFTLTSYASEAPPDEANGEASP